MNIREIILQASAEAHVQYILMYNVCQACFRLNKITKYQHILVELRSTHMTKIRSGNRCIFTGFLYEWAPKNIKEMIKESNCDSVETCGSRDGQTEVAVVVSRTPLIYIYQRF